MSNTFSRPGDWCQLFSGTQFWPLDTRVDEINIVDIAHALANICRFGGHCIPFYSVAQHSVLVSKLVSQNIALQGLMHDATEAYIGDMVRPLKRCLPEFQKVEDAIWKVIAQRFGLPEELSPQVKWADNVALMTERRDLTTWTPYTWGVCEMPDSNLVVPLNPDDARALFLERYKTLSV